MATQYIKYAKKCEKKFFFQIIGGAMAPFGQGVATPMRKLVALDAENYLEYLCHISLGLFKVTRKS